MKLKFAGTTFIRAANNGTADNLWTNFPWEYYRLFLANDTYMQIYSTHLYWKAEHIHIQFKNPLCIQELGAGATGITQSGTNMQAQLFGISDVNYLTAINSKPGPHGNAFTNTEFSNWMTSWRHHGYLNNLPHPLPQVDIADSLFTSIDPDVKEMGMGPGQSFDFGWSIPNQFWRGTTEFQMSAPAGDNNETPRWDPYLGQVLCAAPTGNEAANPEVNYMLPEMPLRRDRVAGIPLSQFLYAAGQPCPIPQAVMSCCADPIPKLWLQLQPQLSGLTSGTGNSVAQLQFEMDVSLALTGRVPRRNHLGEYASVNGWASEYGLGRLGVQTLPIFKPIMSQYHSANLLLRKGPVTRSQTASTPEQQLVFE